MLHLLGAGGPTCAELNLPCRDCGGTRTITYTKLRSLETLAGSAWQRTDQARTNRHWRSR
ncbi:hypothetical protein SAMN05216588_114113 [Pseudomonas flavescens]|uniref:Uncharacterized protein n=1 Tax=Phytopseudomonas flavescens TaxID=29435 RepID=A0A1G8JGC8_9GAMM|nr:hypothetical protein [Pseudomonas flavescens]SDI29700.1 hypothetical protein SAMN05216588_114113 [Pseudomonas flavescens]